ncbi:MAG: ATP-dependent RNA helicase DbpA [Myxococcales bacterium]
MEDTFRSLPLAPAILEAAASLGYERMTPIQAKAIPALLAGQDLIGQSQTGSGKTVAFGVPLLQRVDLDTRAMQALVLCPTRELSAQVARELRKLGGGLKGLHVLVVAGGEPLRGQAAALERGVHIVVGTPGRVGDHLQRGNLELSRLRSVVLDEADRMLDMGFADEMQFILDELPRARQTVLFSATFPDNIEALSRRYQRKPERITIEAAPAERLNIVEQVITVEQADKPAALRATLADHPHESALIFANMKASVAAIEQALSSAGVSVACLHGDLEQRDRDAVLAKFRNASVRVLIATDVAARGIDVESLELVVNYDLPPKPENYVHRIGRTGRAGKQGSAVSFASPRESAKLAAIEELTGRPLSRVPFKPGARLEANASGQGLAREAKMTTLKIGGGRKQKVRPGDILGALTGEAGGLAGSDVGKIEIHDNFSYVAVATSASRAALKSLGSGRIKGKRFVVTLVK